ncbi:MAG TPA: methyltransferase domain-containing protein, partial [Candidatus Eisenbacteria bacterium]
ALSEAMGAPIEVVWVRESATGVLLAALRTNEERYLARLARHHQADTRVRRNAECLKMLAADGRLNRNDRALIPTLIRSGVHAGRVYSVESFLPGASLTRGASTRERSRSRDTAASYLQEFHMRTAVPEAITPETWLADVAPRLAAVGQLAAEHGIGRFARFGASLKSSLVGQTVPVVFAHGNYWLGNILFDLNGAIAGVVDWDMGTARGIALADLYHLHLRDASFRKRGGLGAAIAEADRALAGGRRPPLPLEQYAACLNIPEALWRPLLQLYWVEHIAQHAQLRTAASRDRRWIQSNLRSALESFVDRRPSPAGPRRTAGASEEDELRTMERQNLRAYTIEAPVYDERRFAGLPQQIKVQLLREILVEAVDAAPGARVLDVATGTGVGALALAPGPIQMHAVDLTTAMLANLKATCTEHRYENVHLGRANARMLPFRDGTFDRVVSLRLLHLFPPAYQRHFIDEMLRVLRPGGKLVISLKNPWHKGGRGFRKLLAARLRGSRTQGGYLWPAQMRAVFQDVRIRHNYGWGVPMLGMIVRMRGAWAVRVGHAVRRGPLRWLCRTIIYVCEKDSDPGTNPTP